MLIDMEVLEVYSEWIENDYYKSQKKVIRFQIVYRIDSGIFCVLWLVIGLQ